MLDTTILLANKLALQEVAEGADTALQREYLKKHGVEFIQGYDYARPLSSTALMRRRQRQDPQPENRFV